MVDLCLAVKWSGFEMVVWKPDQRESVYCPKCPLFEWSAKSHDFTIWILDTHTVRYSDDSSIQVFCIVVLFRSPLFCCRNGKTFRTSSPPAARWRTRWSRKPGSVSSDLPQKYQLKEPSVSWPLLNSVPSVSWPLFNRVPSENLLFNFVHFCLWIGIKIIC